MFQWSPESFYFYVRERGEDLLSLLLFLSLELSRIFFSAMQGILLRFLFFFQRQKAPLFFFFPSSIGFFFSRDALAYVSLLSVFLDVPGPSSPFFDSDPPEPIKN